MFQKLKLAISGFTGCVLLFVLSSVPARVSSIRFLRIETPIEISLKKESPSYLAFAMMNEVFHSKKEIPKLDSQQELNIQLAVQTKTQESISSLSLNSRMASKDFSSKSNTQAAVASPVQKIYAKKIVLDEMKIQRTSDEYRSLVQQQQENEQLMEELTPAQRKRIELAQLEHKVLEENWNEPVSFADEAKELLSSSGALAPFLAANESPAAKSGNERSGSERSGAETSSNDKAKSEKSENRSEASSEAPFTGISRASRSPNADLDSVETPASSVSVIKLWGPLEISGGLAVTDQHHLEIRRIQEGVPQEIGRVDLVKGHYSIEIPDLNGILSARLVDKAGRVWGDGSLRLANLSVAKNPMGSVVTGPRLKVTPRAEISGAVATLYSADSKPVAPAGLNANFMKGAEEQKISTEGSFKVASMSKGSSTIARMAAPKYLQSTALLTSGREAKILLFPESFVQAMRDIVSAQRRMSLDNSLGTLIWGAVKMDGKPVRGLTVKIESAREAQVIYLNEMMIPDPSLEATSSNGLYAFLNVEEGFHSISAFRGDEYFGHANVVVDEQAVALGDIESSTRSEAASIKVFDAFSGRAVPAELTLQGKGQKILAEDGSAITSLPQISRMSLLNISTLPQYLQANYFYNDMDAYIHIPLVLESWVMGLKAYRKLDDMPGTGLLVGFVPNSSYEVYLAGEEKFDKRNILYFDYMGRPIENGQPGGGFILFNVRPDVHEVVVMDKSDRIQSQVVPVDSRTVSVLRFGME